MGRLEPAAISAVVAALPNLNYLTVTAAACEETALARLASVSLAQLRALSLEGCSSPSNLDSLESLSQRLSGLFSLRLVNWSGLTGPGLARLAGGLSQLVRLELAYCPGATASCLLAALAFCGPRLTHLSLDFVPGLGYR